MTETIEADGPLRMAINDLVVSAMCGVDRYLARFFDRYVATIAGAAAFTRARSMAR